MDRRDSLVEERRGDTGVVDTKGMDNGVVEREWERIVV